MFHILVQACLSCVWLPQASIDKFFRPQKCETFGREKSYNQSKHSYKVPF